MDIKTNELIPLKSLEELKKKNPKLCIKCIFKRWAVIMKGSAVGPTVSQGFFEIQYTYTFLLKVTDNGLTLWRWSCKEK